MNPSPSSSLPLANLGSFAAPQPSAAKASTVRSPATTNHISFAETVLIQANGDLNDKEFRVYVRMLAEKIMERDNIPVIVFVEKQDGDVMPFGEVQTAMAHAFKHGAYDVRVKPFGTQNSLTA